MSWHGAASNSELRFKRVPTGWSHRHGSYSALSGSAGSASGLLFPKLDKRATTGFKLSD
jgi:hypothetical protein